MSSGVRNLRAMFENQGAASSPEPRGRSPGDNTTTEEEEHPSRPTPKVRASFISVVPPTATPIAQPDFGGATKDIPSSSTASHRRESFSVSQDNVAEIADLKRAVSNEKAEREHSISIPEAVPEQAVASRESSIPPPPIRNDPAGQMANLGSIMKGADFPESSATKVERAPMPETKPAVAAATKAEAPAQAQTPVKTAKKAVAASKSEAPKEPQGPAKIEEKPAPSTATSTPKKPRKLSRAVEKVEVAPPKEAEVHPPQNPVKEKTPAAVVEKTGAPAQAPTSVSAEPEQAAAQPDATEVLPPLAETKEEPVAASSQDVPAPSELFSDIEKKPVSAPIEEAPAPVEEAPAPVEEAPAPVEEAPAPAEVPAPIEEEITPAPAETPAADEKKAAPIPSEEVAEPSLAHTETETEDAPVEAPVADLPADNPDKPVTGAQEEVSLRPAIPTDEATVSGAQELSDTSDVPRSSSISTPKPAAASKAAESNTKANGTPVAKTKMEIKKPAAISTAKASASKIAASKSPVPKSIPRAPTTPKSATAPPAAKTSPVAARTKPVISKPVTVKPPAAKPIAPKTEPKPTVAKEPVRAAPAKTSRTSLRPGALSASTTTGAPKPKNVAPENKKPVTAKPAATSTTSSASASAFKKPTPKSPTRPVKLPAHLIAPTAASAAKHGDEQKITRKPSTATRPKAAAPSTRPARASIAPAAAGIKRPDSRASTTSTATKGDFLSRMMRPTAASSSKTHDKPASPPRKTTKAPVGVLEKGKKKIEEVAAKAKDAITTNGHGAEESKTNGSSDNGESAGAHDLEPSEGEPSVSQDSHDAAPTTPERGSSAAELQTAQLSNEPVH